MTPDIAQIRQCMRVGAMVKPADITALCDEIEELQAERDIWKAKVMKIVDAVIDEYADARQEP